VGSISLDQVGKVYRRRSRLGRLSSLKGALFHRQMLRGAPSEEEFVALHDVSLTVEPGEAVAIIGPNGSGKSTCLKLIGGILTPTSGRVQVEGRVTALIELGAGFHPEISGRENVVINGMLLGLSRKEIEGRMDGVLRFADIGDFIDQPVKTYSSGMYLRLGFAVAVAVDPDVLLIAEILAVGDALFERRCMDRLARMRRRGVTMVIVSHDLDLVGAFADRAVYLRRGSVVAVGAPDAVVARYRSDVAGESVSGDAPSREVRVVEEGRRWGSGDVEITAVEVESGGRRLQLVPSGADCTVRVRYRAHSVLTDFVFGLAWHGADGTLACGHNTQIDGVKSHRLDGEGEVSCRYEALQLAPGEYTVDAAVHAAGGLAYDYWCQAAAVRVTAPVEWPGVWAPPHSWSGRGPEWELP